MRPIFFEFRSLRYCVLTVLFLGIPSILAGVYVEHRFELTKRLADTFTDSSPLPNDKFDLEQNPILGPLVEAQSPNRPRPQSAVEFEHWQKDLRQQLRHDVFDFAEIEVPVDVKYQVVSRESIGPLVTRTSITYESFDGTMIPAYLVTPSSEPAKAAILVIPGHVRPDESGIEQTAGRGDSYQGSAALRLAQAGFATMTPELRGFGYLGKPYGTEHRMVAYNAILAGSFYQSIVVKDVKYAFDLLSSVGEFESVGIAGASFGGEIAVTYAALDTRVSAISFHSFGGKLGPIKPRPLGQTKVPHYCHVIPGINKLMKREDWFGLLAPRPTQGVRGQEDDSSSVAPSFEQEVRKSWRFHSAEEKLSFNIQPGGHQFFVESSIEFFIRNASVP